MSGPTSFRCNNDLKVLETADTLRKITHDFAILSQFFILLSLPTLLVEELNSPLLPVGLLMLSPTIGILLQLALSRHVSLRRTG